MPQDNVTTLGEVRALKPDDEPLDLYRFKNPVKFGDNRFSRDWSEPPSPEQVSMGGGYIMMGVVVLAAAKGINKLTGGPDQIQAWRGHPECRTAAARAAVLTGAGCRRHSASEVGRYILRAPHQ